MYLDGELFYEDVTLHFQLDPVLRKEREITDQWDLGKQMFIEVSSFRGF